MKTCTSCGRKNADQAANCHQCGSSSFILPTWPVDPLHRVGPAFAQFLDQFPPASPRLQQPATVATAVDPLHRVGPAFERFLGELASASPRHDQADVIALPEDVLYPECIGRLSFAVRLAACLLLVGVGALLIGAGSRMDSAVWSIVLWLLAVRLLIFVAFYVARHVLIARLRDMGWRGAWAFLILVPFVNLGFLMILAFVPRVVSKCAPTQFDEQTQESGRRASKESEDSKAA